MKLIVTGAGGLLGEPVVRLARSLGHEVVGVVRRSDVPMARLVDELVVTDLASDTAARLDWRHHAGAAVIHLAGETQIHADRDFVGANLATTAAACRIARQTGGRLVFLSSSAVYSGPVTRYPVRHLHESDETEPTTAYGRSKKAAEDMIRRESNDAVILRLFSVLSPRLAEVPDRGHLVQAILRALAMGSPVVLRVDRAGRPAVRDYLQDGEVAQGILATLALPRATSARVFNLCSGVGTDAREMVAFAGEAAGREIDVRLEPETGPANAVMVGDTGARRAAFGQVRPSRVREFWQDLLAAATPAHLLPKG